MSSRNESIRNIAIIAHVDHGKTTLVDAMFDQGGLYRSNETVTERVMDSNDLERERGITIFSKHASITYKDIKINIVDTPGHSDFGSEVERVLNMVDGVLLLVDAFDGPMPQTKFVLKKALALNLAPIVVINKIDRPGARPETVLDMTFDLFCELNASDRQLDFPTVYASAKLGISSLCSSTKGTNLEPLFETIIKHVPGPETRLEAPFQMQVTQTEYDNYLGPLAIGRIVQGSIKKAESFWVMNSQEDKAQARAARLFVYEGLGRQEVDSIDAGEIACIAGVENARIGQTLADIQTPEMMEGIKIDEPTLSVVIAHNSSPLAGQDGGKFLTSRQIRERLLKEAKNNIGYKVEESPTGEGLTVSGRGELHLTILVETLRREGFEIEVSKPNVILKEINGALYEPTQNLFIEIETEYQGFVIEEMGKRKAQLLHMEEIETGIMRLEYIIPDRTLLGFRSEFISATKGTGVMNHIFHEYVPHKGVVAGRSKGVQIAQFTGNAVAYALNGLQDRGELFIAPQDRVYEGMVTGINNKGNDLVVNNIKGKKLTNMRAAGSDDTIMLTPPRKLTIEWALDFLNDDELLEVTPLALRIRKKVLCESDRKRLRNKNAQK